MAVDAIIDWLRGIDIHLNQILMILGMTIKIRAVTRLACCSSCLAAGAADQSSCRSAMASQAGKPGVSLFTCHIGGRGRSCVTAHAQWNCIHSVAMLMATKITEMTGLAICAGGLAAGAAQ